MRKLLSVVAMLVMVLAVAPAFAMTFTDVERIMHVGVNMGTREIVGDMSAIGMDSDGAGLRFTYHNLGDYRMNFVTVSSLDGETDYFSLPVGVRFEVREIHTEDPARTFWLARTGLGVSEDTCTSFCLMGRYGDTYVAYVTLDDLRKAGLVGHEVWWKVEDGELIVQGWKRNRGKELERTEEMDSLVGEVRLFWDDEAQWMGIRRTMGAPAVSAKDTWFYKDEAGANYYLRSTDMARAWISGCVIKVTADGDTIMLAYKVEDYPGFPYAIYYGENAIFHSGPCIESGLLYGGDPPNPSAVALFEQYLSKELSEAIARRRAAKERHRSS